MQFGAFCTKFRVVEKLFQNAPERKETHENMSLGSNGVDRERSLRNNQARNRGMKFCINCTSLARFAPSFVAVAKRFQMLPNGNKRSKTLVLVPMVWIGSVHCENF